MDVDKPLPNRAYTDPEFFRTERDHVLAKTWVGIAFGSELPSPGYAKPVNFMGLPLLLIRDKAGEVKVFHNVCSHRGMLLVDEDNMSGQGTYRYSPSIVADERLPRFAQWPEDKLSHAEYLSLYPNVLFGLQVDHAYAIILLPQSPDRTLEKLQIAYLDDAATSDGFSNIRASVLQLWTDVFVEDVFAVEAMQQGRQSPGFDGGILTPIQDEPTRHFHNWVAKSYLAAG